MTARTPLRTHTPVTRQDLEADLAAARTRLAQAERSLALGDKAAVHRIDAIGKTIKSLSEQLDQLERRTQ